jgi:1-acyl-sn-glycerol-3-phosphate acyltransferase
LNFNLIIKAIYATFMTNKVGFRLRGEHSCTEKLAIRRDFAKTLLDKLRISIEIRGKEKLVKGNQYLLISNHRSIIDPLIIEIAVIDADIYGHWISKKELFNSFFFGMFTRNAGTILLDRDSKQMSSFFKNIKECVTQGDSVFCFPEGSRTRNDARLSAFKDGSNLIAVKNRLDILPVYIKTDSNHALKQALSRRPKSSTIVIEIGDVIDYKDRSMSIENAYRHMFSIDERREHRRNS